MTSQEYTRYFTLYADDIYRVVLSSCKNFSDAEDIMQDTFLKLLGTKTSFTDDLHVKKWLITVAVNECRNSFRSFWKKKVKYFDDHDSEPRFYIKEHSELYDAVRCLPQKYRIVIHLYYYEGYSVKEISGILQMKESTIQTQLMRAREKLKLMLKEDGYGRYNSEAVS